ncbi:MAG: hypothetical protein IJB80_04555 [Clostridia bacterium]|nr:hypothetical protein [Clostridia bacterium]
MLIKIFDTAEHTTFIPISSAFTGTSTPNQHHTPPNSTTPERHCRSGFHRIGGGVRHQCLFLLQFIPPIFSVKLSSFSGGNLANFTLLFLLHDIYVAFVTYFPIWRIILCHAFLFPISTMTLF